MRKIIALLFVLALATTAFGATLCTDPSIVGVAVVTTPGFTCSLGSLTFSNFTASAFGLGIPAIIGLAPGPVDGGIMTGVSGDWASLVFNTNFNSAPYAFRDITFSYQVTGPVGAISGWMGGFGTRSIVESICTDSSCLNHVADLLTIVDVPHGFNIVADSAALSPGGLATYYVQKDISLYGSLTSRVTMSEFAQGFQIVPEPATFVLIGTGLLGLGLMRRRK